MKDRSPVKKRYFAFFAFSVLYVIYILPFLNNIVFDAIIHFSFAENFVQGHPFRFNQNGETVLASTSPFWTILLIFFFKIAGYKAVLLLKFIIVIVWGGTTYLIYKTAKEIWKFSNILLYSLLLLWMLNVSVLKNSLGGMENILSAFQLILIYYFLCKHSDALKLKNIILLGVLNGWSILTYHLLCIHRNSSLVLLSIQNHRQDNFRFFILKNILRKMEFDHYCNRYGLLAPLSYSYTIYSIPSCNFGSIVLLEIHKIIVLQYKKIRNLLFI
jgi:hypothetical protein